MARRRMIDPNFWDSEDVSRLSIMGRLLLIGLFSNADDFGKGRGNLTTIRSKIFPNDDFSLKEIEKAIKNIKKNINVLFYEVENNQYYKFTKWSHWQRVDKPQTSMIPEPSDSENDSENDYHNGSYSDNESNNDSENDSENDYRLKERKRKEYRGKTEKEYIVFGEFKRVRMTQDEVDKIKERYGELVFIDFVSRMDFWGEEHNKDFVSSYATMLKWIKKDCISEITEKKQVELQMVEMEFPK